MVAILVVGAIAAACGTLGSSAVSAGPADIYAAVPSISDVRKVLGDDNWWQGPPSFEVSPLDQATVPLTEKFSLGLRYIHIGSAEQLGVRYTVYDKTSSATSFMSEAQTAYGTSPSSPRVGDQVLYYGLAENSAAPFVTRTFVRVGQIVVTLVWSRKELTPAIKLVQQLGKNAAKFIDGLKKLGTKARPSPQSVDPKLLPPPGLDITPLGSAQLPIESFAVMIDSAAPGPLVNLFHDSGINTYAYGDYALNDDTHMEVETAILTFASSADASTWANIFYPNLPDSSGIGHGYIPASGSPAAGVYHYVFSAGPYGVLLICKASLDGEAASRECEAPMGRTALAWKVALGG